MTPTKAIETLPDLIRTLNSHAPECHPRDGGGALRVERRLNQNARFGYFVTAPVKVT
jgi:hypothetical protein